MEMKRHTCPVQRPTTRSAMKVSSVSPDRCETMTPQPAFCANLQASMDSVNEPIWFTFKRRQLQAFEEMAFLMRFGLVTVKSSPTI